MKKTFKIVGCLLFLLSFLLFSNNKVEAKDITLTATSTDNVIITGSLGIGTTLPTNNLEVVGDIDFSGGSFIFSAFSLDDLGNLTAPQFLDSDNVLYQLDPSATGDSLNVAGNIIGGGHIRMSGTGNSYFMGNVGIGTNNPEYPLEVNGISYFDTSLYLNRDGNVNQPPTFVFQKLQGGGGVTSGFLARIIWQGYDGGAYIGGAEIRASVDGTPGADDMPTRLEFITADEGEKTTTASIPDMVIEPSGNVGIGTTDPGHELDVSGSIGIDENIYIPTTGASVGGLYVNDELMIHFYGGGTLDNIFIGTNSGNKTMTNTLGGNIGIGTNTLSSTTSGAANLAIGESALSSLTTGLSNNVLGNSALKSLTTGYGNTAIGGTALRYSNGDDSIGIGFEAGRYTSASASVSAIDDSVLIGNYTKPLANSETNTIIIGYGAIGNGSNSVTIGNDSITKTILKGVVTVGSPIEDYHAATKAYVDSTISGGVGSTVGYWSMIGDDIYNSNSGNVGIGTSSPGSKLVVQGDDDGDGSLLSSGVLIKNSGVAGEAGLELQNSVTGSNAWGIGLNGGSNLGIFYGAYDNRFISGDLKLNINTSGNIGIGDSAPDSKLTINSNGGTDYSMNSTAFDIALGIAANTSKISGMDFKNFSSTGQVRFMARNDQNDYLVMNMMGSSNTTNWFGQSSGNAAYIWLNSATDADKKLVLGTLTAGDVVLGSSNTERMRILSTGNIGVGTTVASSTLTVAGTGYFSNVVTVAEPTASGHATTKSYVDSAISGATDTDWVISGNNQYSGVSGNVGIGTGSPTSKLQINSDTDIEGLRIITSNFSPLIIRDSGDSSDLFRLNQEGKLTLASSITPGSDDDTCDASKSGAIKHDSSSNQSYICDGTRWLNQRNCGTITDADGNSYGTVVIGGQCWMAENINVGTMLASASTEPNTSDTTIEKWCYDNSSANCDEYGGLYNWDEAMRGSEVAGAQGICPSGWHIPTDAEWNILENTVMSMMGGTGTCNLSTLNWQCDPAGTALKANRSGYSGTNAVGFNGLLSGYRYTSGSFDYLGTVGFCWSSTPSTTSAWRRLLYSSYSSVLRYAYSKLYGFSIRCLKD